MVSDRSIAAQGPVWTENMVMERELKAGTYVLQASLGEQRWTSRFMVTE